MLVTFKTSARHADITMFGTAARELLKLMGQSGNVPGAIMAEDLPGALDKLKAGIAAMPDSQRAGPAAELNSGIGLESAHGDGHPNVDESSEVVPVSISTRATPLIGLLEAAIADDTSVLWNE